MLDQLPIAPLACYGSYIDARSGAAWLFLEFMRDAVHLNKEETVLESDLLVKAASWIGDFHRVAAANLGRLPVHRLKRYDGNYYDGWIERTLQYSLRCDRAYPWLRQLARDAPKALRRLADERITIIHGEYYPGNILVQAERVTPIDWETAAVAAGEIDLAMLTEGWPSELVRRCERAYGQARWPGKAEPELAERLILARFYLEFRWLGDRPEWTAKGLDQRFERLRRLGCQLRLI